MTTRPILLLTDFGTADPYVAAMKGVLVAGAPETPIFDLSHDVAFGDVEGASFLLAAAAPYWPAGTIFVAVVDPGVGSARRILAVRCDEQIFLAPDNGLLERLFDGGEPRAVERPDLYLPGPGATFHGRDRFAPVAAWLAGGGAFASLGPTITDPVRGKAPPPQRSAGGEIEGRVAHVDRFGNLVTDVPADWLPAQPCELRVGAHRTSRRAAHYTAMPAGEPAMVAGSLGTIEVSLRGESLARAWGVGRGAEVRIAPV